MKYEIASIDKLTPLEKVLPTHLKNLEEMIERDGFILKAIIADQSEGIILDGSHRYVYFLKNGYKTVPVYWVNYSDENIRVGSKLLHRFLVEEDVDISKEECHQRALSGNLFPPRTTRHFFPFRKSDINLPLSQLERGEPVDVSGLIADVNVNDEVVQNEKYIEEIDEEFEAITQYLSEVSQTRSYLKEQISKMNNSKKIAFFPGKFQPPHIGHVQTILNILPYYKKVIIGITSDIVDITVEEIELVFNSFFEHFNTVEIYIVEGVLIEKKDTSGLPKFDVLLSGNPEVLSWAKNHNLIAEYIPRSEGIFHSGTEIRLGRSDE